MEAAAPQLHPRSGPRPGGSVLVIRALSRRFGHAEVIHSLDLALAPGDRVALIGPNGAGKSTVLRCSAGTLTPTSGEITVAGHAAGTLDARRLVGVSLAQERSFYMRVSGRENLLFYARLRSRDRKAAAREVAALVEELELGDVARRRADRCSTGMLQQLGFARALIGAPRLLVLDEPTRSLDRDAVKRVWTAIDRRPDVAVLLATHRDDDLEQCDRRVELPA